MTKTEHNNFSNAPNELRSQNAFETDSVFMQKHEQKDTKASRAAWRAALFVCAIVCTAAVLRSPITSLGTISMNVQDSLALSSASVGLLTTLPLLAFAASSLFISRIAVAWGKRRILALGAFLIGLGILMRSFCGTGGLFAGTAIMGVGISAGNVLLPAIVKEYFPQAIGTMTAVYTTAMPVFAGTACGVSAVLVGAGFGWEGTLAFLAPLAFVAAALWFSTLLDGKNKQKDNKKPFPHTNLLSNNSASLRFKNIPNRHKLFEPRFAKNPLTWWIALFFGVQSTMFYSCIAWIPTILASQDVSSATIALCSSLFPALAIPSTVLLPPIAQRMKRQRLLGAAFGIACILGVLLFWMARSDGMAAFATILLGLALGAPFCLSMLYFGIRTSTPDDSAQLSSIAQTIGYLMAAAGPFLLGMLYDVTGEWVMTMVVFLVLSVLLAITGWKSGDGKIPPAAAS